MNLIKTHPFIVCWIVLGIPLLSYILLRKTFNLALYGDDWLQLYNLWRSFDVYHTMSFLDIRSYINPYWPQYFFLGLIRHFFGYQDQAYFIASFFLRVLSIISLFFLMKEITKNYFISFTASLVFILSAAGLQTTDWVFNMNTYAGIFFYNLTLMMYLKIRKLKSLLSWYYVIYFIFFILALGVVPVRMHGALPLILIMEIFLYMFIERKNILRIDKPLILRTVLSVSVVTIWGKLGGFGTDSNFLPVVKSFYIFIQENIQSGRYDSLFYFLGIIGNIALPDTIKLDASLNYVSTRFILFILLGFLISFILRGDKALYIKILVLNILWAFINKGLIIWNPLLSLSNIFSISIGFQLLILSFLIFQNTIKKYPLLAISIAIGIFWMISFSILYWLKTPYLIIETTGRYMTVGSVGFAILFTGILSVILKSGVDNYKKNKAILSIPILLFLAWLAINFNTTQSYLTNLETNRNLVLANKTWGTLKKEVPSLNTEAPSIFYFTYDNSTAAYMILTFGFWPHAGLSYSIQNWENTPLPTENYKELLEMVKTGEPLQKVHARKATPVPLSRVYAFDFRNGELINITEKTRQQLAKDLEINEEKITPNQ